MIFKYLKSLFVKEESLYSNVDTVHFRCVNFKIIENEHLPNNILFSNVRGTFDPKYIQKCKTLFIDSPESIININWEKFPSIETVFLKVKNINIDEMENCKNITKIFCNIKNCDKICDFILENNNLTEFVSINPCDRNKDEFSSCKITNFIMKEDRNPLYLQHEYKKSQTLSN